MNPTLLIEVTGPSTEHYDRGEKAAHYRRIPSLLEYVLVSHRERRVERWWRVEGNEWRSESAVRGGRIVLAAGGSVLDVDAVYDRSPVTKVL